MIEAGPYRVSAVRAGTLRLDGGAMFGNVPRALWSRHHAPDGEHRIEVALRALLIEGDGRRILVDAGAGGELAAAERERFGVAGGRESPIGLALAARGIAAEAVTDLILTHLHFDHAGGAVARGEDGALRRAFPAATIHLQRANLETARRPNERERRSYLPHIREAVERGPLRLVEGAGEVLPGIFVEVSDGHTTGLQTVRVGEGEGAVVFPADLVPLATHVAIPWTMGYDLCPRSLMEEKRALLARAARHGWTIVLEHDPGREAVRVGKDGERFVVVGDVALGAA